MTLDPYLSPCININSKGIKDITIPYHPYLPEGREIVAKHIDTSDVAEVCADLEKTEWLEQRLFHYPTVSVEEMRGKKMEK